MSICLFGIIGYGADAGAGAAEAPLIGHSYYGQMVIENDDPDVEGGDYEINLFGVDVQKRLRTGLFSFGYETGALLSFETEDRQVRAASGSGGGTIAVSVAFNFILVDYFFGGFIGLEPANWCRLYAGAGPLLMWGSRETEPDDDDEKEAVAESEVGVGVYARVGADLMVSTVFGISVGARITDTTLRFEGTDGQHGGDMDVEGWQYYGGITFKF